MNFQLKPIVRGLSAAFGGLTVVGIVHLPAEAQQQQAQQLERVEITGSNIRRVDAETISPVQVVSREDIERSGKSTVQQLLQSLPIVSGGSFSEALLAGNSFAPGTASVSLRGIGVNTTLVLINGRRTANYSFAQNLDEAFADLNALPIAAIERIEILKSGASAIYGSDAIAGVINIILRKDFKGIEVAGRASSTVDGGGTEYQANLFAGWGNLATDRFNIMGGIDYFQREKIGAADRAFSKNANQEPRSFDFRSPTGNPGTWRAPTGTTLPGTGGRVTQAFANCPPERIVLETGGPACYYDFASDNWLIPKTERIGAYLRGVFDFTQSLQGFAEYRYSNNLSNGSAAPTPGSGAVPTANPSNPWGVPVNASFRFTEVGPRLNEIDSTTQGFLVGLRGSVSGFDWETGGYWSKNDVTNTGTNYIDQRLVNQAFAGTVPGLVGQYWNLTGTNNPALVNALRVVPVRTGESEIKGLDAKATKELFAMAGGNAGIAFGLDYREESLSDTPDALSQLGVIVGSGGTSAVGSRDVLAAYAEVSLPFFSGFESQFAVRFDDYSDFGNATTGKIALSYRPNSNVLLRGGWASGFRAPSLVQAYLGQSTSFPSTVDGPRCNAYRANFGTTDPRSVSACGAQQVRSVSGGNPALKAETSDSYNLGFVFEPTKDVSLGLEYYNINQKDLIDQPTINFLLNNPQFFPPGSVNRQPQNPTDLSIGAPGQLQGIGGDPGVGINRLYFNANEQRTWGVDFDLKYATTLGSDLGRFRLDNYFTYIGSLKRTFNPGQPSTQLVDSYNYPRYRNRATGTWSRGPWESTLGWNYIASYDQFYQVFFERVGHTSTFDLQFAYNGFKDLTLTVGGNNIFNQDPPFGDDNYYGYDSNVGDPRGGIWYLQARYKF